MDSVFYTGLLLFAADVSGVITNVPLNTVAEVGQQAIFNCTSDLTFQSWILTTKREDLGSAAAQNIALNCVVQPGFTAHYEVDRLGSNTICNLIVKDTAMQQAGIYTCTDITLGPSATLIVIDTSQIATYNRTEGEVVEKDDVMIECVLNYNGTMPPAPSLRPYFYWTDFSGKYVSSSYDSTTNYTAVSQLTVTAGRQDIMPYTCHVYVLLLIPTNPGYASNNPTFSYSATSPILRVLFGPSTPIVTSWIDVGTTKGGTCDIMVLNCSSTGNPIPYYKWLDVQGSLIGEQYNLTSTDVNLNYSCQAYNTIRNLIHHNSSTYKVPATDNSTNNSYCTSAPTHAKSTDLLTTVVLATVLGGYGLCNIIATIAFLVYYNHRSNTMNDEHEMSTFKNKAKLNARFPLLQRMLPCINESTGNAGCSFMWITLLILMSIFTGIIVFPILVALINCSRKSKNSKGTREENDDNANRATGSPAYEDLHSVTNRE